MPESGRMEWSAKPLVSHRWFESNSALLIIEDMKKLDTIISKITSIVYDLSYIEEIMFYHRDKFSSEDVQLIETMKKKLKELKAKVLN